MIKNFSYLASKVLNRILPDRVCNIIPPTFDPYPNWPHLLKNDWSRWEKVRALARNGPKILIATGTGGHIPVATLDTFLAVALTMRGANVHFLLCDRFLPACEHCRVSVFPYQKEFAKNGPFKKLCESCFPPADRAYRSLGLPLHYYGGLVTDQEREETEEISSSVSYSAIDKYRLDRIAVGEHAKAGALRFYARGTLDDEPFADTVLRRYFKASLLSTYAVQRLLNKHDFHAASFHHGIYVPQGLVGEVARKLNVRVANWQVAYRKRSFIFSHQHTYHYTMLTEPKEDWENVRWTPKIESETMAYLQSRWQGSQDWIWFHEKPEQELSAITQELGVDFGKSCIGMLTNVMWDAQLHYRANAFPNMLDWALRTIDYFGHRPDLQLLIRVHPAEIRGTIPSRQPIEVEIRKVYPKLPANVFIISADSRISTYAAMLQCDAVIVYGTKTGVELTGMGVPVIVAGEAWIRNKGLTMDASSPEEYFELLDRLPLKNRLDDATTQRARKYAFHFFFRRMIPISYMEPTDEWPPYRVQISGLADLFPGQDAGTDVICEGIMNGTKFVYPAEQYLEGPE